MFKASEKFDAIGKKTSLGCYSYETAIGSRSSTSAADTSIIPEKEDPQISEPSERLDILDKQLDDLLEQLDVILAETKKVIEDNPDEITPDEITPDEITPDEITPDEKKEAIKKYAIRQGTTYHDFMDIFNDNIDDAYNVVTMSGGGYKVKKQRSSKRRSGKRRSGKRRSVKRSNQHKKK